MYTLNKIVGYLISPVGLSMALVAAAVVARIIGRRKLAGWAVGLALANFWLWSTPWMSGWMGVPLEADFLVEGRVPTIESLPQADAIVLHGGSMGIATNVSPYAEMWTSADRVWHAARLWREQVKRKTEKGESADIKILVTGGSVKLTTAGLLQDLGVPTNAVVFVEEPRNTEEEAKGVEGVEKVEKVEEVEKVEKGDKKKVLVVTSAWHMRRTMLMYEKYAPGVEAVPAPCDFENTLGAEKAEGWMCLLPAPEVFMWNSVAFHEWLGYFGYKWLR